MKTNTQNKKTFLILQVSTLKSTEDFCELNLLQNFNQ